MPTIAEVRQQFPQYQDMSDGDLASALHRKFYSDMPEADFQAKIGRAPQPQQVPQPQPPPGFADQMSAAVTDVPSEIGSAWNDTISTIASKLNPFSDERRASLERESKAPFMEGLGEQLSRIGGVGSGIAAIPQLPAAPITGAGRSVIGHGMAAITPGMSYEEGKDAADKALMGMRAGAVGKGAQLRELPQAAPAASDIKAAAKAGYDQAANSGVELHPDSLKNFSVQIKNDLTAKGIDSDVAEKTFKALDRLEQPQPNGAVVTTNNFRNLQRKLGLVMKSPDPTEQLAAGEVLRALNNHMENLPVGDIVRGTPAEAAQVSQIIKEANANYSAVKSAERFDTKIQKAELNSSAANSGQNLENAMRQQVKTILQNPKERRGYTRDELILMEKFVRGKSPANVLRTAGNLLGGGGGLGAIVSGGAGAAMAGPMGIAAPALGWGAKSIGNLMAGKQAAKINNSIRGRSPYAQSLPPLLAAPPRSLLGSIFPYGLPQSLPMLMGAIPARAEDQQ